MLRFLSFFLALLLAWSAPSEAMMPSVGGNANIIAPSSDPITALRAAMVAAGANWVRITASSGGAFAAAQPALVRACYDAGMTGGNCETSTAGSCTASWGCTYASDAALSGTTPPAITAGEIFRGTFAFSAPAICWENSVAIHFGGGHVDSAEGSIYKLDMAQGATNINNSPSNPALGGTWILLVRSGKYIPGTQTKPAWSSQGNGGNTANLWVSTNDDGMERITAAHSYWYNTCIKGTTKVLTQGLFGFGSPATATGASEVTDYNQVLGTATPAYLNGAGTGGNGLIVSGQFGCNWRRDDSDGAIYCWADTFNFYKWTNVDTTPTRTLLFGTANWSNNDGAHQPGIVMPDVFSGASPTCTTGCKRAFVTPTTNLTTQFDYLSDITGTAGEHDNISWAATASFAAGTYQGWAYDTTRGRLLASDGAPQLVFVTPSATLTAWSQVRESTTAVGYRGSTDIPACNVSGGMNKIEYDSKHDVYWQTCGDVNGAPMGDIFMRVP